MDVLRILNSLVVAVGLGVVYFDSHVYEKEQEVVSKKCSVLRERSQAKIYDIREYFRSMHIPKKKRRKDTHQGKTAP